jgi:hypothetical protein
VARPAPLVRVVWIAEVVVVAIGLTRQLGDVAVVAVHRTEAPGPVRIEVELGLAGGDQLGQRAADASRASESIERKAGRQVEALHPRHRTNQWIGIRRHGVGMTDQLHDARLTHEREATRGPGQKRFEPRLVGRKGRARVVPRHAVDPARDRVRLVPTENDASCLRLSIDEVVRVAEARHVVR